MVVIGGVQEYPIQDIQTGGSEWTPTNSGRYTATNVQGPVGHLQESSIHPISSADNMGASGEIVRGSIEHGPPSNELHQTQQ